MYKKILISIITFLFIFTGIVYADDMDESTEWENYEENNVVKTLNPANKNENLTINSRRYTIYDRKSGLSIYGKDEYKQSAMASTTKIMTRNYCSGKM